MKKAYVRKVDVPIYNANVFVIVADDITVERLRPRWVRLFGDAPTGDCNALCSRGGSYNFGLFFNSDATALRVVAHEVFHLTHRIMEWKGEPFDESKHEQGASLNEFLMCRVAYCVSRITKQMEAADDHE